MSEKLLDYARKSGLFNSAELLKLKIESSDGMIEKISDRIRACENGWIPYPRPLPKEVEKVLGK